ncbi:MAG: 3-deoxy-7-phosphoheptulonate synthase [Planctomycetes bacterium]|nr:3-deoxy-7-phosphoheptulonate synthase [Planctomycetota bacterium]
MIIVLKPNTTEEGIQRVVKRIKELGLDAMVSRGMMRTIIGVIGEEDRIRIQPLEAIPGVEHVMPVLAPYKMASREFQPEDTVVRVGQAEFGGAGVSVIAGPCAVESRDQLFAIAEAVSKGGAVALRGGAFKPRTSPYSFQGLGEEGLNYLKECRERFGLPIVTEVVDTRHVEMVARYADVLQIGARNMQNFSLITEAGRTGKPILLKRGMSATVKDLLMSAEYILTQGNSNVILCERGIKTFEDGTRNTVDISAIPALRLASHLPVIVDPSHGTGRRELIAPLARAAVAAGANGIMVEVHHCPEKALCDGPQALLPTDFAEMMDEVTIIAEAMGKTVSRMPKTGRKETASR